METCKKLFLLGLLFTVSLQAVKRYRKNNPLFILLDNINNRKRKKFSFVKVIKTIKTKKSIVIVFKYTDGFLYVLKQLKNNNLEKQINLIFEALSSSVAESAGISVNYVRIVPIDIKFLKKRYSDRMAILCTFVPGNRIQKKHLRFDLKQQQCIKKQGCKGLIKRFRGLPYAVISTMSLHNDLPPIVALDTFIGNNDRGKPNVFYDKKKDRFYGIDLEIAWSERLKKDNFSS